MHIVRTIIWVLLALALLVFSINNWQPVEIKIWEDIVLETKLPALVIISFLLGIVPMWLFHRGSRWALSRRINSLENAARTAMQTAASNPAPHPETAPETDTETGPEAVAEPGPETHSPKTNP